MLKVWNVSLVIVTFFLTIFGTFMTRSGVVQSVHAFGEDRELALMFTGFMVLMLTVSFGLVVYRLPLLRARNELDSWASKEAAFLANNWVLLFSAFFVLFATMFPTLSEAVTGERLTMGPPFFNQWMTPVGLALLFLTGVGPLLAWRKSTLGNLRYQFLWPVVLSVVMVVVLRAIGIEIWAAGLCFGLCTFVGVTILQEFVRGARVRQKATEADLFTSLIGLFARSKRRYGGYVVHLGIVLMFLGFAGGEFEREQQVLLAQRQNITVEPYTVTFNALHVTQDAQKQMVTADVTVDRGGDALGRLYPARWFYAGREEEPTTEVALRRGAGGDLYIVLAAYDVQAQTATLLVKVNPLINWLWFGVGILVLGTGIALLPDRAFAFAAGRVPEGAVTASLVLLMVLGAGVVPARAQHVEQPGATAPVPESQLERDLNGHIVCMCGTCGRKRVGECTCGVAAGQRDEIAGLVAEGKTFDEVVDYFVRKYGSQEVLAAPIDEGFNRLAWAFPYLAGMAGFVVIGGLAVRWTRRSRGVEEDAEPAPAANTELESKLDDALRDLD